MRAMLLALLLPLGGACAAPGDAAPPMAGDPAPDFAAPTLEGDTLALSELRGQVVLLNIWATWCPPCRNEMPALEQLHRDLAPAGLRLLGASIDDAKAEDQVRAFIAQLGITYTILLDPAAGSPEMFGAPGIPATYLIGRDGRLLKRWIGEIDPVSEAIRGPINDALWEWPAGVEQP
ncbi:MAG: peroxiredoxin family protein [Longimicrobiales bacterium]